PPFRPRQESPPSGLDWQKLGRESWPTYRDRPADRGCRPASWQVGAAYRPCTVATFSCRDSRTVASAGGTRQRALSGRDVIARASTSFFAHPSDKRLRPTTLSGSNPGLPAAELRA